MIDNQSLEEIAPGIHLWHAYDSSVKAELYSTALETASATYIVDPIPLPHEGLLRLRARRPIGGICVTSINHSRKSTQFAQTFSVPVYIHPELCNTPDFPNAIGVKEGQEFPPGLTPIMLDGGPAGELALYSRDNGGTIIVGDALINVEPYGFEFLPAKYCLNARLLKKSLPKLLDYKFNRLFFAHGTPILHAARTRLEQLLARRAQP